MAAFVILGGARTHRTRQCSAWLTLTTTSSPQACTRTCEKPSSTGWETNKKMCSFDACCDVPLQTTARVPRCATIKSIGLTHDYLPPDYARDFKEVDVSASVHVEVKPTTASITLMPPRVGVRSPGEVGAERRALPPHDPWNAKPCTKSLRSLGPAPSARALQRSLSRISRPAFCTLPSMVAGDS